MSDELSRRLKGAPVIPLVVPDDVDSAVQTTRALVEGGLSVIEVVLRTPDAVACLGEVVRAVPEAVVGAGTVLTPAQAEAVLKENAAFIVMPGFYQPVVRIAQEAAIPIFPGVATATEAQAAWNEGLEILKFFPASLAGGCPMLKAIGAAFREVSFIPTGGVSPGNLAEFLALANVVACGGSWLTPKSSIEEGDYAAITALADEAVQIAESVRGAS